MSIVLGAFLPHAPLLLPTGNPAHRRKLAEAGRAMAHVAALAYAGHVDTVILFNPHAASIGNTFTFNLSPTLVARFEELGDLSTIIPAHGAPTFAHRLKEQLEGRFPVTARNDQAVNYGMGIPMLAFQKPPRQPDWVEISARRASVADHVQFGVALQSELINSERRVAVIATGDVAAGLSDAAPQGKLPGAAAFRLGWTTSLRRNTLLAYLRGVTTAQADEFASCAVWGVAQLLGTLNSLRTKVELHYDGAPYGVAYQVVTWLPA